MSTDDHQTSSDKASHTESKAHKTHKKAKKSHAKVADAPKPSSFNTTHKEKFATIIITAVVVIVLMLIAFLIITSVTAPKPPTVSGDAVKIIEFSDYECPYCQRVEATLTQLRQKYGNKIDIEYKQFPLPMHPHAQKAAEASECARDQDKFWNYHDVLFENQNALTVPDLKRYAKDLKLDSAKFDACLDSGSKIAVVKQHMSEGEALGFSGTPSFLIGDEKLVGAQPLAKFSEVIDRKLGTKGGAATPATPDPQVKMTVINDPTCPVCDSSRTIATLKQQVFPSLVVTQLNASDAKAQALIKQLGIRALPAYILDAAVEKTARFSEVEQAFAPKVDNMYAIKPGVTQESLKFLAPVPIEGRPVKGKADAPITIVEFSDFQCPYCEKFFSETYPDLVKNYIDTGKAKIVFMHFPLSFHARAMPAAIASECAFEQGKFWEYHDLLFKNQAKLADADLKGYAETLKLDTTKFNACLSSEKYKDVAESNQAVGVDFGVSGTPGFIINGIQLIGAQPISEFDTVISAELAK